MVQELAHEGGARRMAGLFGLFTLRAGFAIRAMAEASSSHFDLDDSSLASMIPPSLPISLMAFLRGSSRCLSSVQVLKKGGEPREHATKRSSGIRNRCWAWPGRTLRGTQRHRSHTECSEELPSTDPTGLLVLCRMHAMLLYGGEAPVGSRDCRAAARPVHKAVWQVFLSPPARVPRESTVKMPRLRAHARPV